MIEINFKPPVYVKRNFSVATEQKLKFFPLTKSLLW